MAGSLTLDTLKAGSGVLATQNGMTGIAKAWVQFGANGGTVTINGSFNISSVTRSATGTYAIGFTTAMPNINYACVGSSSSASGGFNSMTLQPFTNSAGSVAPTTTSATVSTVQAGVAFVDPFYVNVAILV